MNDDQSMAAWLVSPILLPLLSSKKGQRPTGTITPPPTSRTRTPSIASLYLIHDSGLNGKSWTIAQEITKTMTQTKILLTSPSFHTNAVIEGKNSPNGIT